MSAVIVVAGPTASGKTAFGIELALQRNGEIVSADSMQIYRGMDIGTAKATPEEQAAVRHHMIDIADPAEDYSVAAYVNDAAACCEEILSRGKIPVITGGTGLYIDSLLSGRDFGDSEQSGELRAALSARYDELGGEEMLRLLSEFDPERAARLAPADRKRIVRAFEVYILTGETITAHDRKTRELPPRYEAEVHVLGMTDREALYRRIDSRVDAMFAQGLEAEVSSLLTHVPATATAMQAIGYKEVAAALRGEMTMEEAKELIKMSSRRYAKRQMTWFRKYEVRI